MSSNAHILGTITHVETQEPLVALTFDDGPDPETTPRVLEVLDSHGARGTFFMIGRAASRYPEIVRQTADAGHAIGNHSWDHSSFPLLKSRWRRIQIRWCQEVLSPYGLQLFRPPWGHQSLGSRIDAAVTGFEVVTWSILAEDWLGDSTEALLERIRPRLGPGSIVLLHDALWSCVDERFRDREPTIRALDMLLREFGERYRFVTLPELLKAGRPARKHWYWRSNLSWLRREV